jgi:hypothetical protein
MLRNNQTNTEKKTANILFFGFCVVSLQVSLVARTAFNTNSISSQVPIEFREKPDRRKKNFFILLQKQNNFFFFLFLLYLFFFSFWIQTQEEISKTFKRQSIQSKTHASECVREWEVPPKYFSKPFGLQPRREM